MNTSIETNPLIARMEGPSPAIEVARDLVRRAVLIGPILIAIGAVFWGADGAASVAYGLAIVMVNFMLRRIPQLSELFIDVDPFEGPAAARRNVGPLRRALGPLGKRSPRVKGVAASNLQPRPRLIDHQAHAAKAATRR